MSLPVPAFPCWPYRPHCLFDVSIVTVWLLHCEVKLIAIPIERARILRLLIEQIDFNAGTGKIGITFRPTGIAALHDEMTSAQQLAAQHTEEA